MATASTLPALNASMLGTYSNHLKSTLTPAASNQPFFSPMSQATQPGQSLYAIVRAGPLAGAVATGSPTGFAAAPVVSAPGFGASDLQPDSSAPPSAISKPTPRLRSLG